MNNNVQRIVFRFILFLMLQILICNHIHLFGFLNPNIYLLALLLLPFNVNRSVQYLIAFVTGFCVDIFQLTFGIHTFATLCFVFIRPYIVDAMNVGKKKAEKMEIPLPGFKDFKWMVTYTLILVSIHQFMVTMLEVFTFERFWFTLLVIISNTLFTTLLLLCIEYLFFYPKKNI